MRSITKYISVILLALALGCVPKENPNPEPTPDDPSATQRVIIYGDSLWRWGNGCDGCGPLLDMGWEVLNTAVTS